MGGKVNRSIFALTHCDEKGRSEVPSRVDIVETKELLRDFGIRAIIPECTSRAQLYKWRKEAIANKLNSA